MDLLIIENLTAGIEEKELLHGVSLTVGSGETHVLMGPNGAGKSTGAKIVHQAPETISHMNTKSISKSGGISTWMLSRHMSVR